MPNLSPELSELVLAGRSANLPTNADSARILEALRVKLGDGVLAGSETAQIVAASMSTGAFLGKGSLISLAGLAVLGGLWFFSTHAPHGGSPATDSSASVTTAKYVCCEIQNTIRGVECLGPSLTCPAAFEPNAMRHHRHSWSQTRRHC
jgi:hypothetical protein